MSEPLIGDTEVPTFLTLPQSIGLASLLSAFGHRKMVALSGPPGGRNPSASPYFKDTLP